MNLVITMSRRFGTGASTIAAELSEKLDIPVYDKAYIEHELEGHSYADETELIRELASRSCIILGRCASEILRDQGNVFNIYVCADKEDRIRRVMGQKSLPYEEAKAMLAMAEARAGQETEQTLADNAAQCEALKKDARKRLDKAAGLIVGRVGSS